MKDNIKVSICCTTYNHENYIKDALDSFLMQKTNFKYEILIHDDASTDSTAKIIKEYEYKYPDIIKVIYQTENQYCKNKKVSATFLYPRAKGKYIALCEGDDYWTDENKLQLQVDFLENNDDFALCVHASTMLDEETKETRLIRGYVNNKSIELKDFLSDYYNNKWMLFQTSSYVFRRQYVDELINQKPGYYYKACVGDLPLVLFMGTKGKIFFIDRVMSLYRIKTPSSWSKNEYSSNSKKINIAYNLKKMYNNFNELTSKKYNEEVKLFINSLDASISLLNGNYRDVINNKIAFNRLSKREKISVIINAFCPRLRNILKNIKYIIGEIVS